MYAYYLQRCSEWGEKPEALDFLAMVSPFARYKRGNLQQEIGEAIFDAGSLGGGLVAHEMLHCALWSERCVEGNQTAHFGQDCGRDEERLCWTLGSFVAQFFFTLQE